MKLKATPDDFIVEELTDVRPGTHGEYALYRLEKTDWTTPDAIATVRRGYKIEARAVSFGGLKDRHARTTQHLTIFRGPRRNFAADGLRVTHLGTVPAPFTSQDIRANRFTITLRDLVAAELPAMTAAIAEVDACGLPNYFDGQRFGSVAEDGRFVGQELVRGRFEEAVKLALAAPYEFDLAEAKREKEILRQHWGDWVACRAKLPPGNALAVVQGLLFNPTDWRGAVMRLHPDLGGLHLAAYQSHVWNRVLARWLAAELSAASCVMFPLKLGTAVAPRSLEDAAKTKWASAVLPLPSTRLKPDPGSEWQPHLDAVLAEDGLTLAGMRVPGLHKPFFSKGGRPAFVKPTGLKLTVTDDDPEGTLQKAVLKFDLPRGSYATMLVKRITPVLPRPASGDRPANPD